MEKIRQAILKGEIVIMPTETVYGLLCIESSIDKLYAIKNRPSHIAIAKIFRSPSDINITLEVDTINIINKLLPGPFTIIDARHKIGIRIPAHKLFIEAISNIEAPLIMTSANPHKLPPAVTFQEAIDYFSYLSGLDGGRCAIGKPSTLVTVETRG